MKTDRIKGYLKEISVQWKTDAATEHSYRAALQSLLADLIPGVTVVNEPAHIACGAPDLLVRSNSATHAPVGYVETKDIDDGDLDGNGKNKEQFGRYKAELDNLIFTDYLDFRFYIGGDAHLSPQPSASISVQAVRIASIVGGNIVPAAESELERFAALVDFFGTVKPKPITSPTRLAALMAGKARLLACAIRATLAEDADGTSTLANQMEAFRNILIHDLTPESFADIYAQTITYGMFAARLHDTTPEDFSRAEATALIPKTNPFLRQLFQYIAIDLDPSVEWIIDDLVALFGATDVEKVMKGYGRETFSTDPILHFYEDFLAAYDPKLRKQRGVWYTPDPVVNYIVRAVDWILESVFKLPGGLADPSKVTVAYKNEFRKNARAPGRDVIHKEVHRVQLLDPAAGTGTFIAASVRSIYEKVVRTMGKAAWQGYVSENLLPRLNGFEILMASYAMAHLKLDMLLAETGYVHKSDERLRVFLTNSLEPYDKETGTLFAAALAKEANEANFIKRDCPVMVVMGNPPYSGVSSNNGEWITDLVGDYKREPGTDQPLKERKQWLNDDYVKFVRLAEHYIERNGHGIVAYISNNGFVDNPTFRGMRWHLLRTFDEIYVLNLHGNSMKKETAPDGSKDENVFDIMVGTSINIFVKRGSGKPLATVRYADLYGKREDKYAFLESHALDDVGFRVVAPTAPFYFFCPKNEQGRAEYERGFRIDELMPIQSMSVLTARDDLVVDYTREDLCRKILTFCDVTKSDDEIRSRFWPRKKAGKYLPGDTRGWKLSDARKTVATLDHHQMISEIDYRPFDTRYIYYSKSMVDWPRENVMRHFRKGGNLGLNIIRISTRDNHCAVIVTDKIVDKTLLSSKDNANVFPLYLYNDNSGKAVRRPNFDAEVYKKICAAVRNKESHFAAHELSRNWFDIVDPSVILTMPVVDIGQPRKLADRKAVKAVFKSFGEVKNVADGSRVVFPAASAGKMLYQSGTDIHGIAAAFKILFETSLRAWNEREVPMAGHKFHFNVSAYRNYVNRFRFDGAEYFVRFTIREIGEESAVHASTISEVAVYRKTEGAGPDSHPENPEDGRTTPFIDNKISFYFSAVNGGSKGSEESGGGEQEVTPEAVFNYIYGVLHTPSYREKYGEFLKIDFPRIPYPKNAAEFRRISGVGAKLVEVHLLRDPNVSNPFANPYARFEGEGSGVVEKVGFDGNRVYVNDGQYFDNVPEAAWNAYVGGYQPAQKWLKDRRGRTLASDDLAHYKAIVFALIETDRLMKTL